MMESPLFLISSLLGLTVFVLILGFFERRRMVEMLMSRDLHDYQQAKAIVPTAKGKGRGIKVNLQEPDELDTLNKLV